ncbi:hypothetical protein BH11MYX2_BH11MYX2_04340 [soil metagenome]
MFRALDRREKGRLAPTIVVVPRQPNAAALAEACDKHRPIGDYDHSKKWCDDYFFLTHRNETRGIGGMFFDYLGAKGAAHDPEAMFAFVQDLGRAFVSAYIPIVTRRNPEPYTERERTW